MPRPRTRHNALSRCLLFSFCCWQLFTNSIQAQLCNFLAEDTWTAFVDLLETSSNLAILCPFKIEGDACPPTETGLVVSNGSYLTIMCEGGIYGGLAPPNPYQARCIIDCPGNHFTVERNGSLTFDGLTLKGTQNAPSVYVGAEGEFQAFGTTFEDNAYPSGNGGAIYAGEASRVVISQSEFTNNTSQNGGAIYVEGQSQLSNSDFLDNRATKTTSRVGGGAITIGVFANAILNNNFFFGNSAANLGAAILDYSDGLNTTTDSNYGCRNFNFENNATAPCNGIERVNATGQLTCENFETSCLATAQESSTTPPTSLSATPRPTYLILTPPPTRNPSSTTLDAPSPTISPSMRPSLTPTTFAPTVDPCDSDPESFDCLLLGLVDTLDAP